MKTIIIFRILGH